MNGNLADGAFFCERTILIDGKVKCERCDGETSLAQLQAMRLLRGETTHTQFMRELEEQLPLDQDPPAHDRAREIMGEHFISLKETLGLFKNLSRGGNITVEEYLRIIPIPYSSEILEQVKETHWLLPVLMTPWISYRRRSRPPTSFTLKDIMELKVDEIDSIWPGSQPLCQCHDDWEHCSVAEQTTPAGEWVLLGPMPLISPTSPYKNRLEPKDLFFKSDVKQGLIEAARLVYADVVLKKLRNQEVLMQTASWGKPIPDSGLALGLGEKFEYEYISLSVCPAQMYKTRKIAIATHPNSYKKSHPALKQILPDLEI